MRQREYDIVWRSGFTLANARNTPKPRRKSAGKIAIQKALVLTTESIQEFEALYSAHYNHHQPQGEIDPVWSTTSPPHTGAYAGCSTPKPKPSTPPATRPER
jgi:hypothetical protein